MKEFEKLDEDVEYFNKSDTLMYSFWPKNKADFTSIHNCNNYVKVLTRKYLDESVNPITIIRCELIKGNIFLELKLN